MKQKILVAVGVLVVILVAVFGISKRNDGNTIRVGFIGPLTGAAAIYGEEGRNAILLAVDEINQAGGIGGKKISVDIQDGACEGGAAANAWQKLTSAEGLKVIFGGNCSTESATIAPLTAKAHVIALSALTSISNVPNEGEWFFRNSPLNSYYAQAGGKYAYQSGLRSIVLMTQQKDYGIDYASNFKDAFTALGGKVIEVPFAPDATDFRTILTSLKGKTFDGILLSMQGPQTMGLIANQMKELGIQKTMIFSAAFSAAGFLQTTNGYMPPKHWGIVPYADASAPAMEKFVAAYDAKYHEPINFNPFYIAATYDLVYRLKTALEACNANINDVDCLRGNLKSATRWDGAAGPITFSADRKPTSLIGKMTVVNGKEQHDLITVK